MKKIQFMPKNLITENILKNPEPSYKFLPEWYKKLKMHLSESKNYFHKDGNGNFTVKACPPFIDALTAGYMITLPCDITFVDENIYGYRVRWEVSWNVIDNDHTEDQVFGITLPENYEKKPFKFIGNWKIKTPPGYSLLYTHPFYRYDLPFISTTGIVDSDVFDLSINIPFFIKKDFVGTIPAGTPISQIIPIKRDRWKKEVLGYKNTNQFDLDNLKIFAEKSYRRRFWKRKRYE
jgi:hypothetical protein